MSLVDALTESQGVRNRRAGIQVPDTAGRYRVHAVRPGQTQCCEHPPITHRLLTVPGRPCCRRYAMPADWRARVTGQRHIVTPSSRYIPVALGIQPVLAPANTTVCPWQTVSR